MNNNQHYIDTYNYDNTLYRVYDSEVHSSENIFWNEINFFLKDLVEKKLKLFLINTTYKQKNNFLQEDLEFFKKHWRYSGDNRPKLTDNLKKLRYLQSQDLLYFYDNLVCEMFCILSKITDSNYHYDLLIAVKPDFDVNSFYKFQFNLINIVSVNQIYEKDISYDFMKILFDFNKLGSYNFSRCIDKDYDDYKGNIDLIFKNSKEYLDYENFKDKHDLPSRLNEELYKQYLFLLNNYLGAFSEILDQRIYYNFEFKDFGWIFYVLDYEFSDHIYSFTPELKHFFKKKNTYNCNPSFFLKEYGRIIYGDNLPDYYNKGYSFGCLWDVISMLSLGEEGDNYRYNISINEISVPNIKYGTKYKQRLNLV